MNGAPLIVPIRRFEFYSVRYDKTLSGIKGKPHYLTNENYCYFLGHKYSRSWVLVPKGYGTDGASVPEVVQAIIPVWGKHGAAVILHDFLCEYGFIWTLKDNGEVVKEYLTRKQVDEIFFEALDVVEYPRKDVYAIKLAVNLHRFAARPKLPDIDLAKQRYEINQRMVSGIIEPKGEELYGYLEAEPKSVA